MATGAVVGVAGAGAAPADPVQLVQTPGQHEPLRRGSAGSGAVPQVGQGVVGLSGDDPADLVLDSRKEIRVYVEHIICENQERFPAPYNTMAEYQLQTFLKGAIDNASPNTTLRLLEEVALNLRAQ